MTGLKAPPNVKLVKNEPQIKGKDPQISASSLFMWLQTADGCWIR